jgi:Zn-dependent metalloprotease
MSASVLATTPASAAPPKPGSRAAAVAELKASSDRTPTVTTDRSGAVTSLRTAPGHAIDRPAGVRSGASAEFTARGLAKEHGAAFGLRKGDAELRTTATLPAAGGLEVVRFNQTVGDLPVLGADLVVTVRPDGETVSVGSTVTTATPSTTTPEVTAGQAAATARAATVGHEKLAKNAALTVSTPRLAMFDPAVFGVPMRPGMRPVWRTEVSGTFGSGPVGADVLVDAGSGRVVLYANALRTAVSRQVCDHARQAVPATSGPGQLCPADLPLGTQVLKGKVSAVEGTDVTAANADVRNAYNYAGNTYDFFKNLFDRDSIDGNGMQIRSSVRYCAEDVYGAAACDNNAYWDGEQMVYGPGFASADDVVAHELTHGVTEHTANLYYWYQSGAINESMSDVFGEFVDRTNSTVEDSTPWAIGEDLPGGAIRSLSDPGLNGDPDSMTSSRYSGGPDDFGGVHTNSGVGNKAAYLIATGLGAGSTEREGIVEAAHIYYEALQTLPSGADYADLAAALKTSCTTLAGHALPAKLSAADPDTVTFPLEDCAAVDSAIAATAMTSQPTTANSSAPDAPFCPDGSAPATPLFSDDMENPDSGTWANLPASGQPANAYADYFDVSRYGASYAHGGKTSLVAFSSVSRGTTAASRLARIQTNAAVPIPAGRQTFLWFAHADDLTDGTNDGVRVSAAVGTGTTDLGGALDGGAPAKNGYNVGSLAGSAGGAFNGDSHGYLSSRFDLTPFAGKSVKPTFDLVGDGIGQSGWWLDDVQIYTCDGAAPSPVTTFAVTPAATTTPRTPTTTATVSWTAPEYAGASGVRDYTVSVTPAVADFPATQVGGTSVTVNGLSPATAYTFTVTANATDGTTGTAATVQVLPSTTTLVRTPAAVVYGQRVTLSGDVTGRSAGGTKLLGGVPVLVEARPKGTSAWTALATTRSVSTGRWAAAHVPTRGYEYRATPLTARGTRAASGAWAANPGTAAAVTVSWKVTASFAASTIRRGTTAQMRVAVAPARYASLELQRKVGTRWVVVQRAKTTSRGTAVLSAKHPTTGRFAYRVIVRSDAYYVLTATGAYGLTVK